MSSGSLLFRESNNFKSTITIFPPWVLAYATAMNLVAVLCSSLFRTIGTDILCSCFYADELLLFFRKKCCGSWICGDSAAVKALYYSELFIKSTFFQSTFTGFYWLANRILRLSINYLFFEVYVQFVFSPYKLESP